MEKISSGERVKNFQITLFVGWQEGHAVLKVNGECVSPWCGSGFYMIREGKGLGRVQKPGTKPGAWDSECQQDLPHAHWL